MSTYVEADVEQDAKRIEETLTLLPGAYFQHQSMAQQRLYRVKAAALEGVKVPGIVAQGLDMARQIGELSSEVSALQARVAELERERDLLVYERDSEEQRGDEEQRRGDALEAERDALCLTVQRLQKREVEITEERDKALDQRDALRAQVGPMREALEWIERETHSEDGLAFERIHAKAEGTLSAPPAETTPAPERAELEAWKVAHNADCTCTRSIPGMKGPHKVGCPAGVRLGEPQAPCVKCGTAPLLPPTAPAPLCWNHDHQGK